MVLEKNPKTRPILKRMLQAEDSIHGKPFVSMERTRQISVYACGPATLEMLFSFVGQKVSQTSLIRSIRAGNKIKKYGINVNDMAKAAGIKAKNKFSFWKKQYATIGDLDKVVNKYHYPVGVEWQGVFYENEDEDSGHYGVITKIEKKLGFLRIADPYFNGYFHFHGTDRKFKIAEFKKKWWDVNEVKISGSTKTKQIKDVRMMFLITPKDELWPKKLGMKKAG
jgi:ABC-type bacteriocin/lantibiotic exporter with double-glycine peptidase domain